MPRPRTLTLPTMHAQKIEQSLDFLREYEPQDGKGYYVGFSGGKDSIVTLDLVRRAGVKYSAYYNCTRLDHPEIYKFIRKYYPDVQWLYPRETFYEGVRKRGLPLRVLRWCCVELKHRSSKKLGFKNFIFGIRAEESAKRAARGQIDFHEGITTYKPVFNWNEADIWDYIDSNKLPYPTIYDEGVSRVGCVFCPFQPAKIKHQNAVKYPGIYQAIKNAAKSHFYKNKQKRLAAGKPAAVYHDFEEFWHDYLDNFSTGTRWHRYTLARDAGAERQPLF